MKKIKYILPLLAMSFSAYAADYPLSEGDTIIELTQAQINGIEDAIDTIEKNKEINRIDLNTIIHLAPIKYNLELTDKQLNEIEGIDKVQAIRNLENNPLCLKYIAGEVKNLKKVFEDGDKFIKTRKANGEWMIKQNQDPQSGVYLKISTDPNLGGKKALFYSALISSDNSAWFPMC